MKAISIIIPCRNAAVDLPNQLQALMSQNWEGSWEVIVVDNRSTDRTRVVAEKLAECMSNLRTVTAPSRPSAAYARNVGVEAATGDILLFLDADDEVAPGYLAAMVHALEQHNFVAARLDCETLNEKWLLSSRRPIQSEDLIRGYGFLPCATGGSLGMRRTVFAALGGFDESIPSMEDIDFCWRAQLAGLCLHFVPDATVRYRFRKTMRELYLQARNYGRGETFLFRRYQTVGMAPSNLGDGFKAWALLIKRLPRMRNKVDQAFWFRMLGRRVGRLVGSLTYRVVYL